MKFIDKIKGQKTNILQNRNVGTVAWLLHRITGLMLAGYLGLHLCVLGSNLLFGKGSFDILMGRFELPLFKVLEICLIMVIGFHGVNGLRIIIADFGQLTRGHKLLFWIGVGMLVIILTIILIIMWPHIVK